DAAIAIDVAHGERVGLVTDWVAGRRTERAAVVAQENPHRAMAALVVEVDRGRVGVAVVIDVGEREVARVADEVIRGHSRKDVDVSGPRLGRQRYPGYNQCNTRAESAHDAPSRPYRRRNPWPHGVTIPTWVHPPP